METGVNEKNLISGVIIVNWTVSADNAVSAPTHWSVNLLSKLFLKYYKCFVTQLRTVRHYK